jgi:transcriptional regulator with XRE-family HTH domain
MNQNHQIREYISYRRKDLGLSQEVCSRRLGISRVSWTSMESGKRDISFSEFKMIITILQIPLEDVLKLLNLDSDTLDEQLIRINNVIQEAYTKLEEVHTYVFKQIRGTGKSTR